MMSLEISPIRNHSLGRIGRSRSIPGKCEIRFTTKESVQVLIRKFEKAALPCLTKSVSVFLCALASTPKAQEQMTFSARPVPQQGESELLKASPGMDNHFNKGSCSPWKTSFTSTTGFFVTRLSICSIIRSATPDIGSIMPLSLPDENVGLRFFRRAFQVSPLLMSKVKPSSLIYVKGLRQTQVRVGIQLLDLQSYSRRCPTCR